MARSAQDSGLRSQVVDDVRSTDRGANRVGVTHVSHDDLEPLLIVVGGEIREAAAGEVVEDDYRAATLGEQAIYQVAADRPGAPGDHDLPGGHRHDPSIRCRGGGAVIPALKVG